MAAGTDARTLRPSVFKIDTSRYVEDMERLLRNGASHTKREEALAILRRWQFDEMLDDASREKARVLVREFAGNGWGVV